MRKPSRYYSLMRPKIRMSWNKHNVYNISRKVGHDKSLQDRMTFFQQKWDAKSRTRGYHGDHITEKSWKRTFSHRLMSAVELPPEYLATHDGSEQAAGRGSGKSTNAVTAETYSKVPKLQPFASRGQPKGPQAMEETLSRHLPEITPYMQMAFAPLERRLDMAIFRALFASSVRQARQFVIHGAVQVNGKKMVHPSYMLNPGDMFQVDPEKVMYGTGQEKQPRDIANERVAARRSQKLIEKTDKLEETVTSWTGKTPTTEAESEAAAEADADAGTAESKLDTAKLEDWQEWYITNEKLKTILSKVKNYLHRDPRDPNNLSAKRKREMRVLVRTAKQMMSIPDGGRKELADELMLQLSSHEALRQQYVEIQEATEEQNAAEAKVAEEIEEEAKAAEADKETTEDGSKTKAKAEKKEPKPKYNLTRHIEKATQDLSPEVRAKVKAAMGEARLSREDIRNLGRYIVKAEENPVDDSKPYATPWRPKPFMGAFAFIPRYLEVHPHVCAAVYLRHPVARKGMAEVPTPFSYTTNQLAHNWYLARGPRDRSLVG